MLYNILSTLKHRMCYIAIQSVDI